MLCGFGCGPDVNVEYCWASDAATEAAAWPEGVDCSDAQFDMIGTFGGEPLHVRTNGGVVEIDGDCDEGITKIQLQAQGGGSLLYLAGPTDLESGRGDPSVRESIHRGENVIYNQGMIAAFCPREQGCKAYDDWWSREGLVEVTALRLSHASGAFQFKKLQFLDKEVEKERVDGGSLAGCFRLRTAPAGDS